MRKFLAGGAWVCFSVFASYGQTPCTLSETEVASPVSGSTVYATAGAENMKFSLSVWTNCPGDTSEVSFYLDGAMWATVTAVSGGGLYETLSSQVYALGYGQHTLTVSAVSLTNPEAVFEDTSVFYVSSAPAEADELGLPGGNGLPDSGFEYLPHAGDTWLDSRVAEATGNRRLSSVVCWDGSAPGTVSLYDPLAPAQHVAATAPQSLLRPDETALIILQTAPDLVTLYGPVEASIIAPEPGDLPAAGGYVELSVAVSVDGGHSFLEISPSRLSSYPVHLTMSGLQFAPSGDPALYGHPTHAQYTAAQGLHVIAWEGAWSAGGVRNFTVVDGTLNADLASLSVLAPFEGITTPPSLSVSPSGQNQNEYLFGFVEVGDYKEAAFTVTNTGGGTLRGEARVSAPFRIVSDASYVLDSGASKQVVVRFEPALPGVMTSTISFSGGGGAVVVVVGTGYEEPAPEGCAGVSGLAGGGGKRRNGGGTVAAVLLMMAVFAAGARRPVKGC
ncbi:MAG: hypothetical protein NTZ09_18675 [Candidatus Hydrogenedentes bacterium]|nr:hypothetical protein [Candidatus Hydrogenedentota bacterium]